MSELPPIRTITLGIAEEHPLPGAVIQRAATILRVAGERYAAGGYEVQTLRIATRPLLDDLAAWSPPDIVAYTHDLQRMLDDAGLAYCSLGPAQAARPDFPLERMDLLADVLISTSALNATVQLAEVEHGLRAEAARPAARIIKRLADETAEGFGNFRFAMLACVAPGAPFFPAAYHNGPASLSIGLQGASIVKDALRPYASGNAPTRITEWVREALIARAMPVVTLGEQLAREHDLHFGGIDLSPAPMGEDSIVTALELCGYGPFGTPGTLAAAAALTEALKSTGLPTCGYCGLMLPVLEDAALGRRWAESNLNTHQLLLYSAVCGTGLDTIPLPGDIAPEAIAGLLLDVATLALRLRKPLSARLFPVPGRRAGEYTAFTSPYLTNTRI
ncbi:MAG TPA: DUF711 family protein [Ktedonobacteraceae bacterium]|nr:DUF711 family protein [Ktedonobacteraceae bacterium]